MTERLPVANSDNNSWGTVLNGFLGVSHNSDGTLKTVVKVDSATGNSTTDTAALVAARDASAVGATVYVPKGTYVCTGLTLNVAGQHWLLAEGAIIQAVASLAGTLVTISADDVVFEGGEIDGNKTNQSVDRDGINASATNVTVRGVEVHDCRGHGIGLTSSAVGCLIIGNYCHDNGIISNASAGIIVNGGSQNRIIGNRCENNGTVAMGGANDGDGIKLQGSTHTGQNVVSGNICRNNARRGVKVQQGFATISNNVFSGNGVAAVGVTNVANPQDTPTTITGNVSTGDYRGFQLDTCVNMIISNNIVLDAVDYGLLALTGIDQVILSNNVFSNGQRYGANILGGRDWVITGNLFIDNGQGGVNRYGLVLDRDTGLSRDCARINVTGNTSHNSGAGTAQTHGFVLTGTAPDRIMMVGNIAANGVTTPFSLVAGRTNSYEWANMGANGLGNDIPWGSFYMADGSFIGGSTTTGFKILNNAAHKLGFYNKAPVVQPTAVTAAPTQTGAYVQADVQAIATAVNSVITKLQSLGLLA